MYSVVVGCGTAQPPSHTFWLQSQYKLRVVKVTGNLPEHHEASSAKNSLAKQKHRCHCFSLEPSKTSVHNCREHGTHLHTRHRGSNMAATYTVQYHANAHCKLLLYKLASCVVNRRSSHKAMSLSFKQGTMLAQHRANTTTTSLYNVNLV